MHLAEIHNPLWFVAIVAASLLVIGCAAFVVELIDVGKDIDNERNDP
jgi:hypothetical protein